MLRSVAKGKSKVKATRERMASEREARLRAAFYEAVPEEALPYLDQVFSWARVNPQRARQLLHFDEPEWDRVVIDIVWPGVHVTDAQIDFNAWALRANCILKGIASWDDDWPKPIVAMTNAEIIAQLRADAAEKKFTRRGDRIV